jgi:hypothetical protein
MGPALAAVADLAPARWAFATIGTSIDMNARIGVDRVDERRSAYGDDFFITTTLEGLAILTLFVVVLLSLVALLIARRDRV